jgi:hypothetical protein
MAETSEIPNWIDSRDWDTCLLGDVIIPGIVSTSGLKCGVDVDTKKAKGADLPTSTDNGIKANRFKLHVWLTASQYAEWRAVLPTFNPLRPGRARQPLGIIRPDVNELGIRNVRVIEIESEAPTARGGKRYTIEVEPWFDAPKAVPKKKEVPKPANPIGSINTVVLQDVRSRAVQGALSEMSGNNIDPVTGKSVDPSDPEIVDGNYF